MTKKAEIFTMSFLGSSYAAGEGDGTPLQYSCLDNPMDGGAWWTAVHGVAESRTRLSDFTFTFHFYALEKEMATHSSVLAWRIPGTGEPGGLPSTGSHRVGDDWSDLAAAAAAVMQLNKTALQLIKDHLFTNKNWTCLKHTVELTATSPSAGCFSPTFQMLYLIQLAGKAPDL